jgi:hypothetical protein
LREVVAASGAARRMAARRGSELARRGAPGQRAWDAGSARLRLAQGAGAGPGERCSVAGSGGVQRERGGEIEER